MSNQITIPDQFIVQALNDKLNRTTEELILTKAYAIALENQYGALQEEVERLNQRGEVLDDLEQ